MMNRVRLESFSLPLPVKFSFIVVFNLYESTVVENGASAFNCEIVVESNMPRLPTLMILLILLKLLSRSDNAADVRDYSFIT